MSGGAIGARVIVIANLFMSENSKRITLVPLPEVSMLYVRHYSLNMLIQVLRW